LRPRKLTGAAAADLVGVGRPALSNFLNGRAATTPEMATRIEVAFGYEAEKLLAMQSAFDAAEAKAGGLPADAKRYVVPLMGIKAAEIESWVIRNIPARIRLSVLIRTLVNSTASTPTRVDFPGNDDAERPGWDGWSECTDPNSWVPAGQAGWEFGTNADVKSKANGDYDKSVNANSRVDRSQITFIFVTPRHWPEKAEWVKDKRKKKQWKDVRAYDSSDLEQWLEQSIPAQAWFAAETGRPSEGTYSLDKCWLEWASAAALPLPPQLFDSAVAASLRKFTSWAAEPPSQPLAIASDSIEEALAFLSIVLGERNAELAPVRDRAVVFKVAGILPKVAEGVKDFVAIAAAREVERELGPFVGQVRSVVIYPRNAANVSPDVVLEPLTSEAFRQALEGAGYGRDEIARLARESGRSLTVLRRRLSKVQAIQTPRWAEERGIASCLVPFFFIGTWNSTNDADQAAVTLLAGVNDYEPLERRVQELAAMHDPALWSVSTYRGIISKIDMLFAIAPAITTAALTRFVEVAKLILSEDDPRLDLPERDRWAAVIYNKSRELSQNLRNGITETLVLLAVHGNDLFSSRIGFDCEAAVAHLIRELLTPLSTRLLEANENDLPAYAEAAPNEFLSILEKDLASDAPQSYGLMRPVDSFFGGCPRTGLLWALEGLAWSPKTLRRTSLILAQLATVEIVDNWSNKPISSLTSIFRPWMPQTAADHDVRVRVIQQIVEKFPVVGWQLCIRLADAGAQTGDYNHKPKWRNDGHGYGEPVLTWDPILRFRTAVAEIVLIWQQPYTAPMLCDLVDLQPSLSAENREKVWALIQTWATEATEQDKAAVREKIRVSVLSRRAARRAKHEDWATFSAAAKALFKSLEPFDVIYRHGWLFRDSWVPESADELHSDRDLEGRDERILKLRLDAMREVRGARGNPGLRELARLGSAAHVVGWIAAKNLLSEDELTDFLIEALEEAQEVSASSKNLVSGALSAAEDDARRELLERVRARATPECYMEVLLAAPFCRATWGSVDMLDDTAKLKYWREIRPWRANDEDVAEAAERLLAAQRPRAAFAVSQYQLKKLEPDAIHRLLIQIAHSTADEPGDYRLDQHWVQKAFSQLDKNSALTLEQKAGLEFAYIDALWSMRGARDGHKIPNLERYVELHPEFFVQALVWLYKRKDGKEDPPELRAPSGRESAVAERSHKLLEGMTRQPAYGDGTEMSYAYLSQWCQQVRSRAAELGRLEVADLCIGKVLSAAPPGADGVWPCEVVRQVMEDIHSEKLMHGASMGAFNSRGAGWRSRGGAQERQLSARYQEWADALQYSHPFVATVLLGDLVKTYERFAKREDDEEAVGDRMF